MRKKVIVLFVIFIILNLFVSCDAIIEEIEDMIDDDEDPAIEDLAKLEVNFKDIGELKT